MAIDRIDWHEDETRLHGLPWRAAGTCIGMYLAWIIMHHLEGESFDNLQDELEKLRSRRTTGLQVLVDFCDTKFCISDLSEEGMAFTDFYYYDHYADDYHRALASDALHIYGVKDTWANYDVIEPWIDAAYAKWKITQG